MQGKRFNGRHDRPAWQVWKTRLRAGRLELRLPQGP
jgi:hypothetical protein